MSTNGTESTNSTESREGTMRHWSDVYGRDVSALEMMAGAHYADQSLERYLEQQYRELDAENPAGGWDEPPTPREIIGWALQIIDEASGL
jgi:hypothetical protein